MVPTASSDEPTPCHTSSTTISGASSVSNEIKGQGKSNNRCNPLSQTSAIIPFPWKLHRILDDADANDFNDVISWVPTQNGFKVHKPKTFDTDIMPKYFNNTKYKSFQRQLNMWGFDRVGSGPYKGAYLHRFFVRGKPELCESMQRTKIKGIHSKKLRKSGTINNSSTDLLEGGGSSHSNCSLMSSDFVMPTCPPPLSARASFKAVAEKVADLERQKEEIQRKLAMVSNKANAIATSDAMTNMTGMKSMIPHVSLHSEHGGQYSSNTDDFQPLPIEGDSLLYAGRNFFFADDKQQGQSPRRRVARRYSLEPKGPDSDEYILKELQQQVVGLGQDSFLEDVLPSPTPLPPGLDVVTATTNFPNSVASALVIGLDKPKRRFSFLSTPVHNPLEKPLHIPPRPSSYYLEGGRKIYSDASPKPTSMNGNYNMMSSMNTTSSMMMMMMNSNQPNYFNRNLSNANARDILLSNTISGRIP